MSIEENKVVVQRFMSEVWDARGNLDAIKEFASPDYIPHNVLPNMPKTRESDKQFAAMYRAAFPDIQANIQQMVAEGDRVTVQFNGQGTHQGPFLGIPPTGKRVIISGIGIYRLINGKIVEAWVQTDQLGLMQQLGVIQN